MGLSCLWAVNQAYNDRTKAEKQAAKLESVLNKREERDTARQRIRLFNDERKTSSNRQFETDKKRVQDSREKQQSARLEQHKSARLARVQSEQLRRARKTTDKFTAEFTIQNNSVSKALIRHDRQARVEDQAQERVDEYNKTKFAVRDQQDVVNKYLEHRQLMRQTETAMNRAALDTKMLQEANDRLIQAKSRVAQIKARSATVEAFYPLPSSTKNSLSPILAASAKKERPSFFHASTRFETSVGMSQGRVGKHPAVIV